MAMALASKPKKTSKVDPLRSNETELDDLGSPPSTSDLGELFETESEHPAEQPGSSIAAFTDETVLDDSRANSQATSSARGGADPEETSSRSSTPSSAGGYKRFKRNVVTPIHEETSFGIDNNMYENDESSSALEAWGDTGNKRPNTAPTKDKPEENLSTPRPGSAPMSPRSKIKSNKVTPVSSRSSTPVEKININNEKRSSLTSKKGSISKESPIPEEKGVTEKRPTSESKKHRKSLQSGYEQPQSSIKDAWTIEEEQKEEEKSDLPEKALVELDDGHISVQSAEAVLAPPKSSGDHTAYIPIDHAKGYVQKIIEDMKKMKANHYHVVEKIQEQYQLIEEESQAQFNSYVLKLRSEYNVKVSTFRQIIDSHQTEFTNKQKFYEEAIKSLREKNRQLLIQKKEILLKAKDANMKHEVEKNELLSELTSMLDHKHKENVILHQKYTEEKNTRDTFETENGELKRELDDLKLRLELSSGESKKIFDDFDALRKENEELQTKLKEVESQRDNIEEEKGKADELCKEKENVIEEKQKVIEALELQIKELEKKCQTLNERIETAATVTTEEIQQSTADTVQPPIVSVDTTELQQQIDALRKELEENGKKAKEDHENFENETKDIRNEKNIAKMELLNVQEKNKILHSRLEAMLNEVMDTVNVDHIQVKITELQERKNVVREEIDEINKKIEEWKENYRNTNDGKDPTEEEWSDDMNDLHKDLKPRNENMVMIDKEMTVLSMLLDGTLPDDMKQEDDGEKPLDSISDELRKQHEDKEAILKKEIDEYQKEIDILKAKIQELEAREPEKIVETVTTVAQPEEKTSNDSLTSTINELTAALQEAQTRIDGLEAEHEAELEAQKKSSHKLEKKLSKQENAAEKLEVEKRDLESQLKVAKETAQADLNLKQEALDKAKQEIDKLNEEKLAKFPVKAKAEIKALQEKLKQEQAGKDGSNQELLDLKSQNASLTEEIANLNITLNALKEKEAEFQKLKQTEKKYSELKKKYKALEAKKVVTKTIATPANVTSSAADPEEIKKLQKKIEELEKQLTDVPTTPNKKDSKTDPKAVLKLEKANELLKEKVETLKKAAQTDAEKMKELQEKFKEAKAAGGDKNAKKQEKTLKDLQKKFETEQKKSTKLKEDLDKAKEETAALKKEIEALQAEGKKDKEEIAKLGVAAKEGIEAAEKVAELSTSNKSLSEENKTLAENFNSERILRKKYYNMVEDMKGKIRVYARARPLSRSELERGNHNILSSPDEYSLIVQTGRGPKDFQYDAVFTPDQSQEKVFEDTNNLIQSAVDGYNVCIFAYGQTGSGKTYTMIGDKEQKSPGIAPRAFQAIYRLIDENKSKFTFQTSMYMLELYRDNLIDLFGDHKNPAKLDIKKDKKGMVLVSGAEVKEAHSAEDLMNIFEKGSSARHVASTKMNAESSRSHLVLSIIIESTNNTSGAVVKGKLSLVDLAGSERANKTGATAEQLKEAQSINKSLSALGDVISALSSEQSFIPYRNNKLTLLMQDSLGGNAKTLMFVNISPADYNSDETITSLTYASRVKLITNDASKNSENKEIARLKGIISKLKKGESVDDEDV